MKKYTYLLLVLALVVGMSTSGQAQTISSGTSYVSNDAAVVAALAQLNACYAKYDKQVDSILTHSQQIDYAGMHKHFDWYVEHPLDKADRNGYLAYLEQRLHLDAAQEHEVEIIEVHFLAEATPLWAAYKVALESAWAAYRQSRIIQVTTSTSTTTVVAPVVETTTVQRATPRVEATAAPAPPAKKFIRNTDTK